MKYPNLPNNRLIVGGVDLSARFGLVMADGYTLTPPSPKTYTVDIPGGNGVIDLTEALLGDTAYNNRKMDFTFYIINTDNFEKVKTEVSNFLHGKTYDYQITMDPEYTYNGRFEVTGYSHSVYSNVNVVGEIKITINAKPFKHKKNPVHKINAVGGITIFFDSGKERVRPKIETDGFLKVIYKDKLYKLQQGTWTLTDMLFEDGPNEVYFNSYDIKNLTWGDLKTENITFGDFKQRRLYEWYKSKGDGTYVMAIWDDLAGNTWDELSNSKWGDQTYMPERTDTINDIYVEYKVGDL